MDLASGLVVVLQYWRTFGTVRLNVHLGEDDAMIYSHNHVSNWYTVSAMAVRMLNPMN